MRPWPRDVILVVAPAADTAAPDPGSPVTHRLCRDCWCLLAVQLRTLAAAEEMPVAVRRHRPLEFACGPCGREYDRGTIDILAAARMPPKGKEGGAA